MLPRLNNALGWGGRALARGDRLRGRLLPVAVLAAAFGFARLLQRSSPIQDWYIWRYCVYWAVSLVWLASCFSCGHLIVRRLLRVTLPVLEQVTMNFAVGLLAFFMLMFGGGLARLYGSVFFVALPLLMLAVGAKPTFLYLRRLRRALNAARARGQRPVRLPQAFLWALGLFALLLFYLPTIVPSHIGYDSHWYHMPIGEHYARLGRIERFPEGWYSGAIPHLPSIVYCFGFLLPRGAAFDYVELCAHLEFASALMMLPGIPALVRRLAPGARAHASWLAFFAFPAVYVYDLLIGGDQFSAVWPIPICLALLRTFPKLSWRHGVLLACAIAGETLTKYSASGILAGPALAILLRMLWLSTTALWRQRSLAAAARASSGGVVTGAAILLLTTPLWAKNWLWYGDPFYPLLHAHLSSRPWSIDAAQIFRDYTDEMKNFQPPPGWRGVKLSLAAMFNHAFKPSDFSAAPFRGSLFTLMSACIPFVRGPWRLWGTAIVLHIAVFFWYVQLHQDRYLLAFVPAMAAVAVAVSALAWRVSLAARLSVVALFTLHSAWGLSVFALGTPVYNYRAVLDFITAAASGAKDAGMGDLARWDHVGKSIPRGSKVLVHAMHGHTAIGHPSVSDWVRLAGGVSYGRLDSPVAIYEQLRQYGVTHLVWQLNWGDDSFAGDLRFFEFATKYTDPHQVDDLWVGTMPSKPPPPGPKKPLIAFMGCDRYAAGLYPFSAMTVPNPRNIPQPPYPSPLEPVTPDSQGAALGQAQYAVLNTNCGFREDPSLATEFVRIGQRGDYQLFARKDP
jgi:hypothetical protein